MYYLKIFLLVGLCLLFFIFIFLGFLLLIDDLIEIEKNGYELLVKLEESL